MIVLLWWDQVMTDKIHLRATEARPGQRWEAGKYLLYFTGRGNLELWNSASRNLLWQSGTSGSEASKLAMQDDGNLVIYDAREKALWATGTQGNQSAYLAVQTDGNVVIYSREDRPLWQTATHGR